MFDDIRKVLLTKCKENDFLTGGCYIYAKLVTEKYGGVICINRLLEHCAVLFDGQLYDIRGKVKEKSGFRPLKPGEEKLCETQYLLKGKSLSQIRNELFMDIELEE